MLNKNTITLLLDTMNKKHYEKDNKLIELEYEQSSKSWWKAEFDLCAQELELLKCFFNLQEPLFRLQEGSILAF